MRGDRQTDREGVIREGNGNGKGGGLQEPEREIFGREIWNSLATKQLINAHLVGGDLHVMSIVTVLSHFLKPDFFLYLWWLWLTFCFPLLLT